MSRRKAKDEKQKRIVVGKTAQDAIRPIISALNERLFGIKAALNVPEGWRAEHDRMGVPVAFVAPEEKE